MEVKKITKEAEEIIEEGIVIAVNPGEIVNEMIKEHNKEEEPGHETDFIDDHDHVINHGKGEIPCPTMFTSTINIGFYCFMKIDDVKYDITPSHQKAI